MNDEVRHIPREEREPALAPRRRCDGCKAVCDALVVLPFEGFRRLCRVCLEAHDAAR